MSDGRGQMDRRRAAGALLALAACFACTAAAPTASNHTALDLYEGAPEGCYYNFQHYGEGDRIMTNEPCLNCTCHNRMLMCYLRVCPFTKAIGQDCTVEKRADQCCPIVTCPDVPVDLLTSTSTTSPAEYGQTGLGKLDKYGCSISGKYFPEGSKVPPTPNKPCEHCYCIRNMTTCVMQECTLHVDGCTPIYHKDVCCPVRYSCDHPEDEIPLLDDMSTTVRPTPGFLLTTTTVAPVTQMTQDCVHDEQVFADGALIRTEKACEHCYCMKGDIVCVVQECGAPMENEGKNCTSLAPREGQCCPDTYICEGDEISSDLPTESTTESIIDKLTTLSPPRRAGVEGSGYRNEPDEAFTEIPTVESEIEGSGEEQEISKPLESDKNISVPEDGDQYLSVTTKAPTFVDHEVTEISKNDIPDEYIKDKTTISPDYEIDKLTTSVITDEENLVPDKNIHATSEHFYEGITTESGESHNTGLITEKEITKPHELVSSTTNVPTFEKGESQTTIDSENVGVTSSEIDYDITTGQHDKTSKPEYTTPSYSSSGETATEVRTEQDSKDDVEITRTTSIVASKESTTQVPQTYEEEKEYTKPEPYVPSTTTHSELESDIEGKKSTTEPDHAQNTVAISDEESTHPYLLIQATTIKPPTVEDEETTVPSESIVTAKDNILSPQEYTSTLSSATEVSELTTSEPDKGLNTIPSDVSKESSTSSTLLEKTTVFEETKATDSSVATDDKQTANVDIKPLTATETVTALPESTTKGDQFTITTEPSFRKEDESSIPTDKQKESEMTTVKSEFVDEGLIPTSEHDENYSASSEIPPTEEETFTLIPEYTKEVEESIGIKQTTETSPIEILPGETSKPSIDKDVVFISTVKVIDATTAVPEDVYTHKEPSRIPGEGDCLLNGVTYRNNTIVPSSNNCHTGCRCASSIIKCDPIICSQAPDYMDNCQSIYDSPDSCCPTYVCDHPRETVPPQSDNQMSGTESPKVKPTIECRGDQCEISETAKLPTQSFEPCTSSDCSPEADQKPEIDCSSQDCGAIAPKPDSALPSVEKTDCTEGKCQPESCANGECQASPVTPCEGEECEEISGIVSPPSPQSCEHEGDCKIEKLPDTQTTPCEGESCKKIDCGAGNCDPHVISTPHTEQVPCKEGSDCKPEYIPVYDCKGDEPCRRKETSPTEEKPPSKCEGADCEHKEEATVTQDDTYSTQAHVSSFTQVVPEKTTELPESYITTMEYKETEEKDTYTTDDPIDIRKPEKPILEETATKKPYLIDEEDKTISSLEEKPTEKPVLDEKLDEIKPTVQEESTDKSQSINHDSTSKPALMDEDKKEKPDTFEKETESAVVTDQDRTEKPTIDSIESTEKLVTEETKSTETPVLTDKEKEKPVVIKEEGIEKPTTLDKEDIEKPSVTEDDSTEKPAQEIYTGKPSVTGEEEETQKPILGDKDTKEKPTEIAEDSTERFSLTDEDDKEKPAMVEEIAPNPILIDEQDKENPTDITEESTNKPAVSYEDMDKPIIIDEKDKAKPVLGDIEPTTEEYGAKKPLIIDEEENVIKQEIPNKPVDIEVTVRPATIEEGTSTPPSIADKDKPTTAQGLEKPLDEENKDKPAIINKYDAEKPGIDQAIDTEKPDSIKKEHKGKPTVSNEKETEKPTLVEDESEKPVEEKATDKPVTEEDGKEKPATNEENTEKTIVTDQEQKEKPEITDEGYTEQISVVDEKDKEKPTADDETETESSYIEEKDKPTIVTEDSKKKPTNEKDIETPVIEEEGTESPEIVNLDTVKPEIIGDADKEKPAVGDEISSVKPDISKHTVEPSMIDEEDEEKHTVSEENITKKPYEDEDDEKESSSGKPISEEGSLKPSLDEKEKTEEPSIDDEKLAVEEDTTKKPSGFDEEGTEKPVKVEDESTETPTMIEEELTEKPTITEYEGTKKPETDEEEGSGTEIPEESIIVPGKESTKSDIPVQPTEATEIKTPIYESATTPAEHVHSTETNLVDTDKSSSPQPILPTETPEIKVTESQDSHIKVPVILDYTRTSDVATEETITLVSEEEKEKTTSSPVTKMDIHDNKEESSTVGPVMDTDEAELSSKEPEVQRVPELGDIATKAPQFEPISEQEILTDTTQLDLLTTHTPDVGKIEKESTTKVYDEEEKSKPAPESHVIEISKDKTIIPGYESTSTLPEQSVTSDLVSKHEDTHMTESPELLGTKPEKGDTQLPGEEEIKTNDAEIPDKKEVITETPAYSVTEPVKSITEIEDSYVTGQEDVFTRYPEKSTEYISDEVTEKSDKPMPTDIESPESHKTSPKVEYQEQSTQTLEDEKEKPTFESHATEIPIAVVTESHKTPYVPEKEITSIEEKTTRIPDILEQITKDTIESNDYTEKQVTSTTAPESYVTEKHVDDDQETNTKSEKPEMPGAQTVTTDLPKLFITEQEVSTLVPEILHTDSHHHDMKASTDISTSVEDVRTEIPELHVTSEIPQSLVTERQEDLSEGTTISGIKTEESLGTTQFQESSTVPELHIHEHDISTETPVHATESIEHDTEPEITVQEPKITNLPEETTTEKLQPYAEVTEKSATQESEVTTAKQKEEVAKTSEQTTAKVDFSETTPYWIELDEHTHKIVEDISTDSPVEKEHTLNAVEDISTTSPTEEEQTHKIVEDASTISPEQESSTVHLEAEKEPQIPELTTKKIDDEEIETSTKEVESATKLSVESSPEVVSEKVSESSIGVQDTTATTSLEVDNKFTTDYKEHIIDTSTQLPELISPAVSSDAEKTPISEAESEISSAPETSSTEKPAHSTVSQETIVPEDEFILSTAKATTLRQNEEIVTPTPDDKFVKPEEKPSETTEVSPLSTTSEVSKPNVADMQPTDEIPAPEEEHFGPTGTSGYGEPDYVEEDQAFGPGTCRYGGKVYVSAQQIPRDDPCDFCFCFRSDIICLQQSCPPPIHGCHEEPIQGFCCPRYECPVSMATTVNVTTTTTTTTTTLPPHFPTHSYKGAAQRRGCQIKGHTYKVGEVVRSSSGPCLHCTCGGDGQMKCDPKACTPEPMLRQMIAAAVSAKRRR